MYDKWPTQIKHKMIIEDNNKTSAMCCGRGEQKRTTTTAVTILCLNDTRQQERERSFFRTRGRIGMTQKKRLKENKCPDNVHLERRRRHRKLAN